MKMLDIRQSMKLTSTGTHNCQYQSLIKPKFAGLARNQDNVA